LFSKQSEAHLFDFSDSLRQTIPLADSVTSFNNITALTKILSSLQE